MCVVTCTPGRSIQRSSGMLGQAGGKGPVWEIAERRLLGDFSFTWSGVEAQALDLCTSCVPSMSVQATFSLTWTWRWLQIDFPAQPPTRPVTKDLSQNGCGWTWLSPDLPMTWGKQFLEFNEVSREETDCVHILFYIIRAWILGRLLQCLVADVMKWFCPGLVYSKRLCTSNYAKSTRNRNHIYRYTRCSEDQ